MCAEIPKLGAMAMKIISSLFRDDKSTGTESRDIAFQLGEDARVRGISLDALGYPSRKVSDKSVEL